MNQTGKEQTERVDEEDDGKGRKQEVLKMVPGRGSATTCDAQGCSCVTSCYSDAVKCRTVVLQIQISFLVIASGSYKKIGWASFSPLCNKKVRKVSHKIIHTKQLGRTSLKHSSENQETVRTHTQTPHKKLKTQKKNVSMEKPPPNPQLPPSPLCYWMRAPTFPCSIFRPVCEHFHTCRRQQSSRTQIIM